MEALNRLETIIDSMLSTMENLRQENSRLREEVETLGRDRQNLADENQNLRASLERELQLREEALSRVEALIQKVRDHDCMG